MRKKYERPAWVVAAKPWVMRARTVLFGAGVVVVVVVVAEVVKDQLPTAMSPGHCPVRIICSMREARAGWT